VEHRPDNIQRVIRRRGTRPTDPLARLVADTQDLVIALVRENRSLKLRNEKLSREVDRLSEGWDQITRLARQAPRPRAKR
jgi:cell division protein FtsB